MQQAAARTIVESLAKRSTPAPGEPGYMNVALALSVITGDATPLSLAGDAQLPSQATPAALSSLPVVQGAARLLLAAEDVEPVRVRRRRDR